MSEISKTSERKIKNEIKLIIVIAVVAAILAIFLSVITFVLAALKYHPYSLLMPSASVILLNLFCIFMVSRIIRRGAKVIRGLEKQLSDSRFIACDQIMSNDH